MTIYSTGSSLSTTASSSTDWGRTGNTYTYRLTLPKRQSVDDNLVRAWTSPGATQIRAKATADGSTMFGHFAVFNRWTEIDSLFEGRFLERMAPGAFLDTFRTRGDQIRVLYDHGADPSIGNKPLGVIESLGEDTTGAAYEVSLFDASYVNDLKPAIRSNQLGASFRFKVTEQTWVDPSEPTDWNPEVLAERTINAVELYEFGPVTFPAYAEASAGLRSRTDEFVDHLLTDPRFVARFTERVGLPTMERILATLPPSPARVAATDAADHGVTTTESADGDEDDTHQRRSAYFDRVTPGFAASLESLKEAPQ